MTLLRMDNILLVVEDLDAMIAFFTELGLELQGRATVEGEWADRVIGLEGARSEIVMLRPPDGHGGIELTKFHVPEAIVPEPSPAPVNTLGYRRVMFAVDDVDDVVARLQRVGAELVGDVMQYEDAYRLCFMRGPEGVVVGIAEPLGEAGGQP